MEIKVRKHGYKKIENERKVKEAYDMGATSAHKISKVTGLHYQTAQAIMNRLGLVDLSAAKQKAKLAYYVYENSRGDQTFLLFKSIYEAVNYFIDTIDGYHSLSHATKIIREALDKWDNRPIEIYKTSNARILLYSPAHEDSLELRDENFRVDWLPELD